MRLLRWLGQPVPVPRWHRWALYYLAALSFLRWWIEAPW